MKRPKFSTVSHSGGRILLLLLLFLLALYNFRSAGINAFAIICILPAAVLFVIFSFRYKLLVFWLLFTINYFLWLLSRLGYFPGGVPLSLPNEMLELMLIAIALVDYDTKPWNRTANVMLLAIIVWCLFGVLEVLNDECQIGLSVSRWYGGYRLLMLIILYVYLSFILFIETPRQLMLYLIVWAIFSLFSVFWVWKQSKIGLLPRESAWLYGYAYRTHIVGGMIRYWSVFSDAASFGIHMAAVSVCFIVIGLTNRMLRNKIFYILVGLLCAWAMFQSGTRTAVFCLIAGFLVYMVLSRNVKIITITLIFLGIFVFILAFTKIGQGNNQIRRMRSAFNSEDASLNVRDVNKAALRGYMKDAPWGLGLNIYVSDIPPFNKMKIAASIPPDSEYVFIWVRTGVIGIVIFIIMNMIIFLGASWIVFFRLKQPSLRGIGAGLCSAFIAMQLGGYANQVLFQYPNGLIFYGGISLVYMMPFIERDYQRMEYDELRELVKKRIEKRKKESEKLV